MKATMFLGAFCIAAAPLITTATVGAQSGTAAQKDAAKQITVTGCVQRESDYRKANDKGRAGVAGTGIGGENEYVLTNAMMATAAEKTGGTPGGAAYELTGENEKLASGHVGHRVEITGMLKAGEATGGATAGTPPKGVDVLSKDLRLRELEVTSVKMISANCTQ